MYEYDILTGQRIIDLLDSYGIESFNLDDSDNLEAMINNPDVLLWNKDEKMFRDQTINEKLFKILGDVRFDSSVNQDGLGTINHLNFVLKQERLNIRVVDFLTFKGLSTIQSFRIVLGDQM